VILDTSPCPQAGHLGPVPDSASDRTAGMARLSADLVSGKWRQRYGHLLALDELDLGYCIVVARNH
jgi:hypothetical protein